MGLRRYGRNFWIQAGERAAKTAVQGALALIPADTFNVLDVDNWKIVAGAMATGFVLSIATSIVTAPVGPAGTPSVAGPVAES